MGITLTVRTLVYCLLLMILLWFRPWLFLLWVLNGLLLLWVLNWLLLPELLF